MKISITPPVSETELKHRLIQLRSASLAATRRNDFRTVAELTRQTAALNHSLQASRALFEKLF